MEPVYILLIVLALLAFGLAAIAVWWATSIDVPMSASSSDWSDDDALLMTSVAAATVCILAAS